MKILITLPAQTKPLTIEHEKSDSIASLKVKIEKMLENDHIRGQIAAPTTTPKSESASSKTTSISKKKTKEKKIVPQTQNKTLTLCYKGVMLQNDKKVEDYGIQDNDLIELSHSKPCVMISSVFICLDKCLR